MRRVELHEEDARRFMEEGGVPGKFTEASSRVAVILTQSWCPQWKAMDAYLARMESEEAPELRALRVFYLVYDLLPCGGEFMAFKENTFKNGEIPFVLYYAEGKLTGCGNYVSEASFRERAQVT
ncbi:MAG: hypothetical protein LBC67_05710 [Spirochaetales bacterium]|jgi:hypothetical protein|nr:hypothetical protein [Spirochaetales bacterium]